MADSYRDDPDVELMLRVVKGDRPSFELLVTKYQKTVLNTAFRYTGNPAVAEELAQDVFVRVYRAAPAYKPEARFSTWLFTIVRNVCSNYRSREGRLDQHMDSEIDPSFFTNPKESPEEDMIRTERKKKIRDAIRHLPESLRLPLILHQFNHLSYDQVAEVLEISLGAVKVRIHRARLALMEQLKEFV
ncbi:sigma-70 family RNA polymerase sigma factor [bacterium]|nr:sigma-70 family RNA polymerase sigma factor [bacterium]